MRQWCRGTCAACRWSRARTSRPRAPIAAPRGYSRLQIGLHWTIAALIVIQLVYNEPMQRAFDDRVEGDGIGHLRQSHRIVASGLTKKKRAELGLHSEVREV